MNGGGRGKGGKAKPYQSLALDLMHISFNRQRLQVPETQSMSSRPR